MAGHVTARLDLSANRYSLLTPSVSKQVAAV